MIDNRKKSGGFSLMESLISLSIISFFISFSIINFKPFFSRIEFNTGVRNIVSSLNMARYRSIRTGRNVKFGLKNNSVRLLEKIGKKWVLYSSRRLKNIKAETNSSPVFHPAGNVSPLCSITVGNRYYSSKISLSIAGRIKIRRLF